MTVQATTIGIVGARGHTGSELIKLVVAHPHLQLLFVSSRELAGQPVADHNAAYRGELRYESLMPTRWPPRPPTW